MASVAKFRLTDTPRLLAHCSRTQKNQGSHIDKNRTSLNFNMAEGLHPEDTDYHYVKNRVNRDDVKMMKRDDVKAACSWAVTIPKELCHEVTNDEGESYFEPNDSDECREFFQASYDFFKEKHGEDNIVSAYVHMDENMPHMHFIFTPIVKDKNGQLKVCAKEALADCYGAKFQIALQDYVSEKMGKEIHMVKTETVDYERNVKELKKKTLNQRCAQLAKEINKTEEALERKKASLRTVSKAVDATNIDIKTSSTNGFTVMRDSDWAYIQNQLKFINAMKTERREIKKELEALEETNLAVENQYLSKKSNELETQNKRLKTQLSHIQEFMEHTEIKPGLTIMEYYEAEVDKETNRSEGLMR